MFPTSIQKLRAGTFDGGNVTELGIFATISPLVQLFSCHISKSSDLIAEKFLALYGVIYNYFCNWRDLSNKNNREALLKAFKLIDETRLK